MILIDLKSVNAKGLGRVKMLPFLVLFTITTHQNLAQIAAYLCNMSEIYSKNFSIFCVQSSDDYASYCFKVASYCFKVAWYCCKVASYCFKVAWYCLKVALYCLKMCSCVVFCRYNVFVDVFEKCCDALTSEYGKVLNLPAFAWNLRLIQEGILLKIIIKH